MNGGSELSSTEAELYFKTEKPSGIYSLQELLEKEIREKYPLAVVTFSPPETIFEKFVCDRRSGCGSGTPYGE